jgi:hypothetical protein
VTFGTIVPIEITKTTSSPMYHPAAGLQGQQQGRVGLRFHFL